MIKYIYIKDTVTMQNFIINIFVFIKLTVYQLKNETAVTKKSSPSPKQLLQWMQIAWVQSCQRKKHVQSLQVAVGAHIYLNSSYAFILSLSLNIATQTNFIYYILFKYAFMSLK